MVYTQVCASCHSLKLLSYRNLVGVCYTEDEAKALAEKRTVMDGPNDAGEMFDRPGKLSDALPSPYKNDEQARSINNGALPPDLSLIIKSRGRREDYLFALLTGYRDPPAGVTVNEAAGQYYNPYFAGGKIGMPKQLVDGAVEYPDGTPATESQMAKDVATFLAWAAEPEHDDRKKLGLKWMVAVSATVACVLYYKRCVFGGWLRLLRRAKEEISPSPPPLSFPFPGSGGGRSRRGKSRTRIERVRLGRRRSCVGGFREVCVHRIFLSC